MKLFKQLYLIGLAIYLMSGLILIMAGYNVYLNFDIKGNRKPKLKEPIKQEIVEVVERESVDTPKRVVKSPSQPVKPTKIVKDTVVVTDTTKSTN